MSNELLLFVSVLGNVLMTLCLKLIANSLPQDITVSALLGMIWHPALWIGGIGLVVAAVAFLVAARTIPISIAYSVVTGGTILGMVLAERLAFGVSLSAVSLIGIALITSGVIMVAR